MIMTMTMGLESGPRAFVQKFDVRMDPSYGQEYNPKFAFLQQHFIRQKFMVIISSSATWQCGCPTQTTKTIPATLISPFEHPAIMILCYTTKKAGFSICGSVKSSNHAARDL